MTTSSNNREKALLSHMFNKAREWGYTDAPNPCQGVKGFTESGRDRYVSDTEFAAVRSAAEGRERYWGSRPLAAVAGAQEPGHDRALCPRANRPEGQAPALGPGQAAG